MFEVFRFSEQAEKQIKAKQKGEQRHDAGTAWLLS